MFLVFGYFLPGNVVIINGLGFLIFFAQGLYMVLLIVMLNNTVEYDEYKYGERHESVISSVRSFSAKLSGAMNQGILAVVLIISGIYSISQNITNLEVASGKGEIPREEVFLNAASFIAQVNSTQMLVLCLGMVAIPMLCFLLCYWILNKHVRMDELEYQRIVEELELRKSNTYRQD